MAGNEFQIRLSKASLKKPSIQMITLIALFRFIAMKGITSTTIRNKKYENSRCNKPNSPVAFAARPASDRTGAGYHRRVDSRVGPRNARVRA
jgi:hypothetical protein